MELRTRIQSANCAILQEYSVLNQSLKDTYMLIIIITKEVNVSGPLHQLSSSGPSSVAVQGNVPAPDQARAGQINNTRQRAATHFAFFPSNPQTIQNMENKQYTQMTCSQNILISISCITTLKIFMYFKQFQVCMSCGKSEGRNGGCECNVGVCHLAWTWHQLSFESLDNSGSRTLHYITILSRA